MSAAGAISLSPGLRSEGLSLPVAEQNVQFLDLAEHVFTIEGGRTRFSGTLAELAADDHLRRAYFGLAGEDA